MTVIIPTPTPVTGVHAPGGKPGMRLPIQQFKDEQPLAFNLYIQALIAWQKNGNEKFDRDQSIGTSYFQITGIHGVPYGPWQDDPTQPASPDIQAGYCTHRSVLFVPWHRPYLMLYEQILYEYAKEIAAGFTGQAGKDYRAALAHVRLPYWDWSRDSHLPPLAMLQELEVKIPGPTYGSTIDTKIKNPLYSYEFTSQYAKEQVQGVQGWHQMHSESKRCPDMHGHSQMKMADDQMAGFSISFKPSTYRLLTTVDNFDEFSCNAWKPTTSVTKYGSVEAMHNDVHNITGTQQKAGYPTGNMTALFGSAFDPIFWLHHCHIDRLAALWQAIHPNYTVQPLKGERDRYTAKARDLGPTSNLEPFHKTIDHDMNDYHTLSDTKEVTQTFSSGYYYPETPLELLTDPDKMREYTLSAVNELYGPPKSFRNIAPIEEVAQNDWQVFVRVRNFALPGSWGIYIFFGEPPVLSDDWFMASNRVGAVSILANDEIANCSNCRRQAAEGLKVTGSVILNHALRKASQDVDNVPATIGFLTQHLTWRVVKGSSNVQVTPDLGLSIGVSVTPFKHPASLTDLPEMGEPRIIPEITENKLGGWRRQNKL